MMSEAHVTLSLSETLLNKWAECKKKTDRIEIRVTKTSEKLHLHNYTKTLAPFSTNRSLIKHVIKDLLTGCCL